MLILSAFKAHVGGLGGHVPVHPDLVTLAGSRLAAARKRGIIIDGHVATCGEGMLLLVTHERGEEAPPILGLAVDVFSTAAELARSLRLDGSPRAAGSKEGCGVRAGLTRAELPWEERLGEGLVVLQIDKAARGGFNLPLCKVFADPFNTPGLVLSEPMLAGFEFEVVDLLEARQLRLAAPEETYLLLAVLGSASRYAVRRVLARSNGETAAACATGVEQRRGGREVDPVLLVRCQGSFPAVGEVLEPFAQPWLVQGWMRGAHHGPIMPVAQHAAHPSRFGGPPRAVALGYQVCEGRLMGPRDLFDDSGFDRARAKANELADVMRSMGPFEPHRLPLGALQHTGMPHLAERLQRRWVPLGSVPSVAPEVAAMEEHGPHPAGEDGIQPAGRGRRARAHQPETR